MIELKFNKLDIKYNRDGGTELILTVPQDHRNAAEQLYSDFNAKPCVWVAKLSKWREKRSLDANSYLWLLCDKIAKELPDTTKEFIYQEAIKEVGVFNTMLVENIALDETIKRMNGLSLGSFAIKTHDSQINRNCSVIRVYYGSSSYDTKEMSVLVDHIVKEAQGLGIQTMTPRELERLKALWGEREEK